MRDAQTNAKKNFRTKVECMKVNSGKFVSEKNAPSAH
ncbi:hypothetical protein CRM22_011041 [Opisthorchis felineus]|uniref:Uncharacterized protein n=1 Tax=Opisthorchis felineus TaxID=147828 RepID=A0A4S2KD28_OPIFE|nr:hypothetical protein CRM22_011041 [Opisthorchis felineus]